MKANNVPSHSLEEVLIKSFYCDQISYLSETNIEATFLNS